MAGAKIIHCDFSEPKHLEAIATLINTYIDDEMGEGELLTELGQEDLIAGLKNHPKIIIMLAVSKGTFAGLLVAFENFSTFTAKPMINVHDVFVLKKYRSRGIGRQLMNHLITEARNRNCSRVTLEVRKDNFPAQNLYIDLGFDETDPEMFYWRKYL
ncbi:MAG: GNAT family N-acetyltransferase [Prevotellaceae bacterium]|jgi:ribosomal protein S18 acetylase RimI-like enzyme|nr:GNAT family N-acetyltransferase [Prevotellaceae bacterium]